MEKQLDAATSSSSHGSELGLPRLREFKSYAPHLVNVQDDNDWSLKAAVVHGIHVVGGIRNGQSHVQPSLNATFMALA